MLLISKNNIIKYLKKFDIISDRVCIQCPMNTEYFLPFLKENKVNENAIKYFCKTATCAERFAFLTSSNEILLINDGCIGRKEELKKIIKEYNIIENE